MLTKKIILACFILALLQSFDARAGVVSQVIREAAEIAYRKLGGKASSETVETFVQKAGQLAARHGESVVVKALGNPKFLELLGKYGDEVFEGVVRHGDNADILITQYGDSAALALAKIEKKQGRHIMAMHQKGELAKIGGADKVFGVVEKYGNKAADFIWRNKVVLAGGTLAIAFYNDPEPFIDGVKTLVADVAKDTTNAAGAKIDKTLFTFLVFGVLVIVIALFFRKPLWKLCFSKRNKN